MKILDRHLFTASIKMGTILLGVFFGVATTYAKDTDSTKTVTKEGWSFGAVPVIAYDADIGFKYGGVVNFYHYGDGSRYPAYDHSLYFEWSRTTKGSGINQFIYDSEHLIPGIRITAEVSYLTEKALDFYGFNGNKALYDNTYEDDADPAYRSRMYYRQERSMLRLRTDFQGRFFNDKTLWLAGICHYGVQIDTVNIHKLNEGKSEEDKLPPVEGGLFGMYAYQWNIIPKDQINGGNLTFLKAGLVYDTRDNEPKPNHGLWSEALLLYAPSFIGNDYSYVKLALTHRQYFTLIKNRLNFAYRLGYQDKLVGDMPYYMLPIVHNGGSATDKDGLGGAKTMRGILRNRVVGEDFLYGNFELRWVFLRGIVKKQNIYLALSGFADMGMVTSPYIYNKTNIPADALYLFPNEKETPHTSIGAGFHIALNENFIIACDYGLALNERDGDSGLYINLNWLF